MNSIIKLEHVYKNYGNRVIFEDLNIKIEKNSFTAIVGESGQGKSTLLNLLGLIDRDYCGAYFLFGRDVSNETENESARIRNREMGFIYQNYNLIEELNAQDNIYMPFCYSNKKFDVDQRTYIEELMELLKIECLKKRQVKYLSGGEKQRIAIARAMALNPSLVLADEPTGNLDSHNTKVIFEFFKGLKKKGKSVIVVTHDTNRLNEYDNVLEISELRKR